MFSRKHSIGIVTVLAASLTPALCWAGAGDLDPTFGVGGLVTTNFAESNQERGFAVAIQADGKIVVAGIATDENFSSANDFGVVRYNPDGSLDTSFGTDGRVRTDFASSADFASGVAIQADGKIVVVGSATMPGIIPGTLNSDFGVARYNSDGTLDTTFDGDGRVTTDFEGSEGAAAVAIQADGKILVVGNNRHVARYNPDGSLDTNFGTDGKVTIGLLSNSGLAVAIQSGGKIVIAGGVIVGFHDFGPDLDFGAVRLHSNGSMDNSFGTAGVATIGFGLTCNVDFPGVTTEDLAAGVAIQTDGRIVLAGQTMDFFCPERNDFALARLLPNGNPDDTFGTGAVVRTDFAGNFNDQARAVAIQADGKIVLAGWSSPGLQVAFALARYRLDGSLDTGFGVDGKITTHFDGPGGSFALDLAIQADGKIVVAGYSDQPDTEDDFAVARYEGVSSSEELIELIKSVIADVQELVLLGALNNGQGNALLRKLQGAIQTVDAGQNGAAINMLEAFISQVNAFVDAGILLPSEGEPMVIAAANLILLLQ